MNKQLTHDTPVPHGGVSQGKIGYCGNAGV
jgi:hypothetical protein